MAKFAGPRAEVAGSLGRLSTESVHVLKADHGLYCANEHRDRLVRVVLCAADDVEAVVHSVREVDICGAW